MHKGSELFLKYNTCSLCKGLLTHNHKTSGMSLLKRALRKVTGHRARNESNDDPIFACKSYHVFHRYCLNGWCNAFKNQSRCSCPVCKNNTFSNCNSRKPATPIDIASTNREDQIILNKMLTLFRDIKHVGDTSWQNIDNEAQTTQPPSNARYTPHPNTRYTRRPHTPQSNTRYTPPSNKTRSKSKSISIEKSHSRTRYANKPSPIVRTNTNASTPTHPFLLPETTYYEIFNILPNNEYDNTEIKKIYKTLALKYHPDRGQCAAKFGAELCTKLFQKVGEAKDTLMSDNNKMYFLTARDITQSDLTKFQEKINNYSIPAK